MIGIEQGVQTTGTRSAFLRRGATAGGTLVAGGFVAGAFPGFVSAAASPAQDVRILNLTLTLEYLEEAFYAQALRAGKLTPALRRFAETAGAHERAHVQFLEKALGRKAIKKPTFDFRDTITNPKKFSKTAVLLEDTGVEAYNGQAANLTKPVLEAAAKIVSVEARHAGWIRAIRGDNPAPRATDRSLTADAILERVKRTGFITS